MKDFVSFIKNYSTRDFIYFFSEISIELYKKQQNKSEDELRCIDKYFYLQRFAQNKLENLLMSSDCDLQ